MEWFSWVIAIGIGLSAVISPIVTAKINNKHQLAIKKLDMYENTKREILSNFIDASEHCLFNSGYTDENIDFCSATNKLFIYFDDVSRHSIKSLSDKIAKAHDTNDYSEANHALANIVQALSMQIKKS